ncbi:hypothetical protein FRB98_006762, partial [Tulasnella sp. 332]
MSDAGIAQEDALHLPVTNSIMRLLGSDDENAKRVTMVAVVFGGSGAGFATVDFKDANGNFIGELIGLGVAVGGAIGINGDSRF